jgi:excinuclease ABC subunit A
LNDALPPRSDSWSGRKRGSNETAPANEPLRFALQEVRARLHYLDEVGLGYLTLDRPTRSLSGGETERVNLTTCLGTKLVNTLYVLDEPSVGLHPRDTERLVRILRELRDLGNTVVVVEHEPAVMRAADHIVDLGPGHGEAGGSIIYDGPFEGVLGEERSLTGQYLSGRKQIESSAHRLVNGRTPKLRIENANAHNLRNLTVEIPLNRFVCLTGVSGSGKTTLAREVLYPLLEEKLGSAAFMDSGETENGSDDDTEEGSSITSATLNGYESLGEAVLVDQSPLGRTPRSNPAVYIGAFESIRELFAATESARQQGLNASAFSFNSGQGQCEKCRGAGFEKIEMQFLSDVFVTCPECNGRRYREHILGVKLISGERQWSIGDLLDATVDEVIEFLGGLDESRARQRALSSMKLLQDVGLGYLRAGQPINTLSGGESQRLKLVSHLAESVANDERKTTNRPKLFIFDEPTTGLHFDDVRVLVDVFQRLVNDGHSLLVIEHNLELIRCADWLIDLGPDAGDRGGEIVAEGTPERVAENRRSFTGRALAETSLEPVPA